MKMNKTSRTMMLAGLLIASSNVFALECAPDMYQLVAAAPYSALNAQLTANDMGAFNASMGQVTNFATATETQYQALFSLATAKVAAANAAIPTTSARIVITLPDGTVVVDTGKSTNTLDNFKSKAINENHNSRLAILDAQQYPCGFGMETKVSTSVGAKEVSLAKRIGLYMNSLGTVRISYIK
jgi:hypothetical protein